jgi:hypothetical protein
MPLYLPFEESLRYDEHNDGIVIPVTLHSGPFAHQCFAAVDCGASVCLFSREVADLLKIDVERGEYKRLRTLAGNLEAFGHEVSLTALNLTVESVVYFARYEGLPRNLLGRQGWLRKLKFGLVENDYLIYAGRYDV